MSNLEQLAYYQKKLSFEADSWDLYLALNAGENIVVVDGRSEEAYQHEHIPGAINLPHKALCFNNTAELDKSKVYICYCDGIGGLDWWKRDGYATEGHQGRDGTPVSCGC